MFSSATISTSRILAVIDAVGIVATTSGLDISLSKTAVTGTVVIIMLREIMHMGKPKIRNEMATSKACCNAGTYWFTKYVWRMASSWETRSRSWWYEFGRCLHLLTQLNLYDYGNRLKSTTSFAIHRNIYRMNSSSSICRISRVTYLRNRLHWETNFRLKS